MNLSLREGACGSRRGAGCDGPCRVWLHDGSLPTDMRGRHKVGRASEPAPRAADRVPRGGGLLVDQPASRALPRGVALVHQDDRHPGACRLVGAEPPELPERPGVRVRALGLANRYPAADPAQVLELDPEPGAFGLAYAEQHERDYQALLDAVAAGRAQAVMRLSGANPRPPLTGPLLPRIPGPRPGPSTPSAPALRTCSRAHALSLLPSSRYHMRTTSP